MRQTNAEKTVSFAMDHMYELPDDFVEFNSQ